MKFTRYVVVLILASVLPLPAQSAIYSIKDFGAKSDGSISTAAIQEAINTCSEQGGGTVDVPSGVFFTGTLLLKDNINFRLEAGAVLKGSPDITDYLDDWRMNDDGSRLGLFLGYRLKNVSFTGTGVIDGNDPAFMNFDKPHIPPDFNRRYTRQGKDYMPDNGNFHDGPVAYSSRPVNTFFFIECENLLFKDITIKNSPNWTFRIELCEHVDFRGIDILNNPLVPNNDGIHITSSRNVMVSDCDVQAGDDAIIVTGFETGGLSTTLLSVLGDRPRIGNKSGYAENVTVTNCTMTSRSAGIRVGYGDIAMRNIVFQNLVIYNSNRGIGVFSRDQGSIENVLFSDITIETRLYSGHWWGNGEPIHVSAVPQQKDVKPGKIKNIRFRNILAKGEAHMLVYGMEDNKIENVLFDQVQFELLNSPLNLLYGGNIDLRPVYMKDKQIFKYDSPGLYCRQVKGLVIKDFNLISTQALPAFFHHGIWVEDFEDLQIDGFRGKQTGVGGNDAAIVLTHGSGVTIRNCVAKKGTSLFLKLSGVTNEGLFVNNNLKSAKQAIDPIKNEFKLSGNLWPRFP